MISQPVHNEIPKNKPYKDPLKNPLLVAASYSNEIGAALNVITPRLGAALWIPTFMYLGADIYDKYKNDKDVYSPSSKRGLEQVISQSVSSILLPAIPILVGQKMTSPVGKIFSDRLSINEKDAAINEINLFIDQIPNNVFDNKKGTILINKLLAADNSEPKNVIPILPDERLSYEYKLKTLLNV